MRSAGCACLQSDAEKHAEFLAQYSGYVHEPGEVNSPVHSTRFYSNLQERRSSSPRAACCHMDWCDNDLVHPSLYRPMRTDFLSLTDTGAGTDCAEICRAVCVADVVRSKDHGPPAARILREGPEYIDFGPMGFEGEVHPVAPPAPLPVPRQFQRVEYDWATPSEQQKEPSPAEMTRLKDCLKCFAQAMLDGVLLQLRLDPEEARGLAGQNMDAMVSFTTDLSTMQVSVSGVRRAVPLDTIRWVRPPPEVTDSQRSWFLPGERALMVILRIQGGKFLRLRFQSTQQAAYFGTCMKLLVKARGPQSNASTARS